MLLECLDIAHHIQVVRPQSDEWFWSINPLKMVPALEDVAEAGQIRPKVFESGACLRYIASKYDTDGNFSGNNDHERAQVSSWLAMHDSGLG